MSLSPDRTMCAVAGREVIGILAVGASSSPSSSSAPLTPTLEPVYQLTKNNMNNTVFDIAWHPSQRDTVATAAVNGAVLIWNLNYFTSKQTSAPSLSSSSSSSSSRKMTVDIGFTDSFWKRRVNKLCWHPTAPHLLLMAVQDGSIKLLDIRAKVDPSNPVMFPVDLPKKAASVRDVRFSPFFTDHFASALEDGSVRLWDARNPACQLFQVQAHLRLALALEWHPLNRDVLASCGSDGVKVWDVGKWRQSMRITPLHSMHSSSSVSVVHWRAEHPDEIASCASTLDFKTYVWNVRRPCIPIAQFHCHTDVTSDFAWLDADTLVTCSKDTTVRVSSMRAATRPFENIRTVAAAFDPRDRLFSVKEFLDRKLPVGDQDGFALMPRQSFQDGSVPWPSRFITESPATSPEPAPAASSASAARSQQQPQSQQPGPQREREVRLFDLAPRQAGEPDDNTVFREIARRSHTGPVGTSMTPWEICEHNATTCDDFNRPQFAQLWRLARCAFEPTVDVEETPHEQARLAFDPSAIFGSAADSEGQPKNINTLSSSLVDESEGQGTFLFVAAPHQDDLSDLIRAETVTPITEFPDLTTLASQSSTTTTVLKAPSMDEERMEDNARTFVQDWGLPSPPSPPFFPSSHQKTSALPQKMLQETVARTLDLFNEIGDVQICALVALVIGPQPTVLPFETISRWIWCYLSILQCMQLFTEANEVIKSCPPEVSAPFLNFGDPITSLNTKSTKIKMGFPDARKTKTSHVAHCCICQLPVKGVYVWCQGCGHGGHLEHMHSWFEMNHMCPTGCSHICHPCSVTLSPMVKPNRDPS